MNIDNVENQNEKMDQQAFDWNLHTYNCIQVMRNLDNRKNTHILLRKEALASYLVGRSKPSIRSSRQVQLLEPQFVAGGWSPFARRQIAVFQQAYAIFHAVEPPSRDY